MLLLLANVEHRTMYNTSFHQFISYGQSFVVSLTRQDKVHAGLKTVKAQVERVQ